jgi:hypothetical protein
VPLYEREELLFKGEKSYRWYWILIAVVSAYTITISFLPWLGYGQSEKQNETVKLSSYAIIGFTVLGILFLMVYMRSHLRSPTPIRVKGEQVLPHKLQYLDAPVGPGRKIEPRAEIQKHDRWEDQTCKERYVENLCISCTHHRRRYYGNFCKHFGMVVDRPTHAAS